MESLTSSLLTAIQHLGAIDYLLILLISFGESLVLIGELLPGGTLVVIAGFLSAQGYLNLGNLILFAALGAILGDSLSYWLGTKGTRFFRNENKILKLSHLQKGEQFFKKHGKKSILLGRFIGIMRPIVPFVAGLFRMRQKTFLSWNIVSGILWAASYILLGYFFGGVAIIVGAWTTHAGFFALILFASIFVLWFFIKQSKSIFSFLFSIAVSIKNAVISNESTQKLILRYPRFFTFLKRRFDRKQFSGLTLTLMLIAFIYIISLFVGVVEEIVSSGPIVAADIRIANLLYAFRHIGLITFFSWVTLLAKWQIVVAAAIVIAAILGIWKRHLYILPFWATIAGAEIFNLAGKLAFHHPRPQVAYYLEHGFSFPSGHATMAVAFYGFLTCIFLGEIKKWRYKTTILFCGLVVILAIGLSRLYLGAHYLSDVWAGYLSGLLVLIISMAIVEWIKHRRHIHPLFSPSAKLKIKLKIITGVLLAAFAGFYVLFALHYHPPLNSMPDKKMLVVENVLAPFKENKLPKFTETILGSKQEPLSFIIVAKSDARLMNAMSHAGWHLADKVSLESVFTLAKSIIANKSYPTAPMTPSFWNAKVQDFGFEKGTPAQNVKERHHIRFWKTNLQTKDGKHIYAGTASFDSGVKWLIAHKINPDIDAERELLFTDLGKVKVVARASKETFVSPLLGQNFSGDPFFTDGKLYLIFLK